MLSFEENASSFSGLKRGGFNEFGFAPRAFGTIDPQSHRHRFLSVASRSGARRLPQVRARIWCRSSNLFGGATSEQTGALRRNGAYQIHETGYHAPWLTEVMGFDLDARHQAHQILLNKVDL
jgi:hypothetical protein